MDTNVTLMDLVLMALVAVPTALSVYTVLRCHQTNARLNRLIEGTAELVPCVQRLTSELQKTDSLVADIIAHIERTDAVINSIAGDVLAVDADGEVDRFEGPDGE